MLAFPLTFGQKVNGGTKIVHIEYLEGLKYIIQKGLKLCKLYLKNIKNYIYVLII